MLTPAIAALITRLFFYENKFKDANLRFGRLSDYGKYWLFLRRLSEKFAAARQDMESSLPPGFMPQLMLMIYFLGGLTVFNILLGMITEFGEEDVVRIRAGVQSPFNCLAGSTHKVPNNELGASLLIVIASFVL